LARADGARFSASRQAGCSRHAVTADWNGFAVLHNAAARVGGLDVGSCRAKAARMSPACLARRICLPARRRRDRHGQNRRRLRVYIGTHGDAGAHRANVILPASRAYTEKSAPMSHRRPRAAGPTAPGFAAGEAREDWQSAGAVGCARQEAALRFAAATAHQLYGEYPHLADRQVLAAASTTSAGRQSSAAA